MSLFATIVAFLVVATQFGCQIPPTPANNARQFTHAGILSPDQSANTATLQQQSFKQHDVPIVAIVHRMAIYGYQGEDIQPFAAQ